MKVKIIEIRLVDVGQRMIEFQWEDLETRVIHSRSFPTLMHLPSGNIYDVKDEDIERVVLDYIKSVYREQQKTKVINDRLKSLIGREMEIDV